MDEDDEILEEIPVYLSKHLSENLFVLQYPLKGQKSSFEKSEVVNCCVKPQNNQIKIDFALNTASKHYDAFKGEQFALATDGKTASNNPEHPTFRSGTMDKCSYTSHKSVENSERYTVAVLQDKEVYLVPVKSILQMRQNFSYFDKQDKRTKAEQKAENGSDDDADDVKQITVKFARADNDKLRKAREKSYNFVSKIGADEPWCETLWHSHKSHAAEMERQKIFEQRAADGSNNLDLHCKNYLNDLIMNNDSSTQKAQKSCADETTNNDAVPDPLNESEKLISKQIITMSNLHKLPLKNQICHLLRDSRVVSLQTLLRLLDDSALPLDKVLRTLNLVGVLVRGNWVLQSELLYPPSSVSGTNGVSAEFMCKARDYVLYQFTKVDQLNRAKIAFSTQIPTEEAKEILETVARLLPNKMWELLESPNLEFEKKYPEITNLQQMYFNSKEPIFTTMENVKFPNLILKFPQIDLSLVQNR